MARTSTPWRLMPVGELGCGSEATVRRRLVEWSNAAVFERLHDPAAGSAGRPRPGGLVAGEPCHHERACQTRGDHVGAITSALLLYEEAGREQTERPFAEAVERAADGEDRAGRDPDRLDAARARPGHASGT
jgi:transposase